MSAFGFPPAAAPDREAFGVQLFFQPSRRPDRRTEILMQHLSLTIAATAAATLLAACAHVTPAPPEVRRITLGTTELAYVDSGRGTPVLLVHGAGSDWRSWEPLRPHWPSGFRHIAYSLRGHYPTDPAGAASTAAQHALDLREFIRSLGTGPVHAVGFSLGGRIVLEAALAEPTLFRSVVSSDPLIARPTQPQELASLTLMVQDFGKVVAAARTGDQATAVRQLVVFTTGEADGMDRLPTPRRERLVDNAAAVVAMATTQPSPPPTCDQLGLMKVPVLLLQGEHTRAGFRASNDRLMACLPPASRRELLPGVAHAWQDAAPEAAARAIQRFIQAQGG
jgi:pimeloyl-ACP methyl ester carboxylesterase